LAAVRLADEERRGVVGMNHDPRVELEEVAVGIRTGADGLRERARAREGGGAGTEHERARRSQEIAARQLRIRAAQRVGDHSRKFERAAHALRSSALSVPFTTRLIAAWMR
jgi:hypothetical protein